MITGCEHGDLISSLQVNHINNESQTNKERRKRRKRQYISQIVYSSAHTAQFLSYLCGCCLQSDTGEVPNIDPHLLKCDEVTCGHVFSLSPQSALDMTQPGARALVLHLRLEIYINSLPSVTHVHIVILNNLCLLSTLRSIWKSFSHSCT